MGMTCDAWVVRVCQVVLIVGIANIPEQTRQVTGRHGARSRLAALLNAIGHSGSLSAEFARRKRMGGRFKLVYQCFESGRRELFGKFSYLLDGRLTQIFRAGRPGGFGGLSPKRVRYQASKIESGQMPANTTKPPIRSRLISGRDSLPLLS